MYPLTFGQSLGLAGAQGALNFGSTMLQNYYNKQMAQYQNDWNLEMWNRQNEYNSPRETMNRLVDAGINPRAYQQIGQFANAGQPQAAAPRSKISELSAFQSVARQGLENQLLSEQVKQAKQDTRLKELTGGKVLNEQELQKLKYILTSLSNGLDPQRMGGSMVTSFFSPDGSSLRPAYENSNLWHYLQTGDTSHPYLLKHRVSNLLQAAGVDLRHFETEMKKLDLRNYETYGVRGSGLMNDTGRLLINLVEFIKRYTK